MEMTPGQCFGPYEILDVLGAGGMGIVYRARDPRLGREVAIKTLPKVGADDPVRLKRFEQEAQAASALNHPNVVTVYDVGEEGGIPYLVTELFQGQTLRQRLRQGPIGMRKAIEIAIQVAQGLSAVHERGIVHRDLKPDNLFLTADGHVKILDFGISRATEMTTPPATIGLTQSGAVMGTAGYMSPEQVRGRTADARSDIFALGAILYEMVTGAMAFAGETPVERGYAILNSEPPGLSTTGISFPPALERVIRRCLEKAPEERFQMARDLAFALEAITDTSGLQAQQGPDASPKPRFPARSMVGITGAALVLGLLAGWLGSRRSAAKTLENPAVIAGAPRFERVTFRNGAISTARFAKGSTIVFSGIFEGDPMQVFSGVIGSPNTRPVSAPNMALFDNSSADELAIGNFDAPFKHEDTTILSKSSLSGGAPRQVLEDVLWAAYSPDGKQLLVIRKADPITYTLEFPPGHVLLQSREAIARARMSPSGEWIAFERHPVLKDDRGRIEVVDLKGQLIARSHDSWTLEGLAWSPSSREVWFSAGDRQPQRFLQALSVPDGKEREVLRAPTNLVIEDIDFSGRILIRSGLTRSRMLGRVGQSKVERSIGWLDGSQPVDLSSDGNTLLFIEGLGGGTAEIQTYLRTFDGSPPVLLAEGWGRALSPDKKWALISPKPPFVTLALVPTGPGSPQALPPGDFASIGLVRWFNDGDRIVFSGRNRDGRSRLYLQSIRAVGNETLKAPIPVNEEDLELVAAPSPDGKQLLALRGNGMPVRVTLPGGKVQELPGLSPGQVPLQWSHDGRELFVGHLKKTDVFDFEMLSYDVKTGKSKPLVTDGAIGPRDTVGLMGIRGGVVSPDCKHYVYTAMQRLDELYVVEGLK